MGRLRLTLFFCACLLVEAVPLPSSGLIRPSLNEIGSSVHQKLNKLFPDIEARNRVAKHAFRAKRSTDSDDVIIDTTVNTVTELEDSADRLKRTLEWESDAADVIPPVPVNTIFESEISSDRLKRKLDLDSTDANIAKTDDTVTSVNTATETELSADRLKRTLELDPSLFLTRSQGPDEIIDTFDIESYLQAQPDLHKVFSPSNPTTITVTDKVVPCGEHHEPKVKQPILVIPRPVIVEHYEQPILLVHRSLPVVNDIYDEPTVVETEIQQIVVEKVPAPEPHCVAKRHALIPQFAESCGCGCPSCATCRSSVEPTFLTSYDDLPAQSCGCCSNCQCGKHAAYPKLEAESCSCGCSNCHCKISAFYPELGFPAGSCDCGCPNCRGSAAYLQSGAPAGSCNCGCPNCQGPSVYLQSSAPSESCDCGCPNCRGPSAFLQYGAPAGSCDCGCPNCRGPAPAVYHPLNPVFGFSYPEFTPTEYHSVSRKRETHHVAKRDAPVNPESDIPAPLAEPAFQSSDDAPLNENSGDLTAQPQSELAKEDCGCGCPNCPGYNAALYPLFDVPAQSCGCGCPNCHGRPAPPVYHPLNPIFSSSHPEDHSLPLKRDALDKADALPFQGEVPNPPIGLNEETDFFHNSGDHHSHSSDNNILSNLHTNSYIQPQTMSSMWSPRQSSPVAPWFEQLSSWASQMSGQTQRSSSSRVLQSGDHRPSSSIWPPQPFFFRDAAPSQPRIYSEPRFETEVVKQPFLEDSEPLIEDMRDYSTAGLENDLEPEKRSSKLEVGKTQQTPKKTTPVAEEPVQKTYLVEGEPCPPLNEPLVVAGSRLQNDEPLIEDMRQYSTAGLDSENDPEKRAARLGERARITPKLAIIPAGEKREEMTAIDGVPRSESYAPLPVQENLRPEIQQPLVTVAQPSPQNYASLPVQENPRPEVKQPLTAEMQLALQNYVPTTLPENSHPAIQQPLMNMRQPAPQNFAPLMVEETPRPAVQQPLMNMGQQDSQNIAPLKVEETPRPAIQQPLMNMGQQPSQNIAPLMVEETPRPAIQQPLMNMGQQPSQNIAPLMVEETPRPAIQQPLMNMGQQASQIFSPLMVEESSRPAIQQPLMSMGQQTPQTSAPLMIEETSRPAIQQPLTPVEEPSLRYDEPLIAELRAYSTDRRERDNEPGKRASIMGEETRLAMMTPEPIQTSRPIPAEPVFDSNIALQTSRPIPAEPVLDSRIALQTSRPISVEPVFDSSIGLQTSRPISAEPVFDSRIALQTVAPQETPKLLSSPVSAPEFVPEIVSKPVDDFIVKEALEIPPMFDNTISRMAPEIPKLYSPPAIENVQDGGFSQDYFPGDGMDYSFQPDSDRTTKISFQPYAQTIRNPNINFGGSSRTQTKVPQVAHNNRMTFGTPYIPPPPQVAPPAQVLSTESAIELLENPAMFEAAQAALVEDILEQVKNNPSPIASNLSFDAPAPEMLPREVYAREEPTLKGVPEFKIEFEPLERFDHPVPQRALAERMHLFKEGMLGVPQEELMAGRPKRMEQEGGDFFEKEILESATAAELRKKRQSRRARRGQRLSKISKH